MKIIINEKEGRHITLPLPNHLLFNGFVGRLIQGKLEKEALMEGEEDLPVIPYRSLPELRRMLQEMRKTYPGLPLVEVQSANGDQVTIYP